MAGIRSLGGYIIAFRWIVRHERHAFLVEFDPEAGTYGPRDEVVVRNRALPGAWARCCVRPRPVPWLLLLRADQWAASSSPADRPPTASSANACTNGRALEM